MMEKVRDTCAIVQAPTESEHVLFVLVRPPNKGGIPALSVQQKLAATQESEAERTQEARAARYSTAFILTQVFRFA